MHCYMAGLFGPQESYAWYKIGVAAYRRALQRIPEYEHAYMVRVQDVQDTTG